MTAALIVLTVVIVALIAFVYLERRAHEIEHQEWGYERQRMLDAFAVEREQIVEHTERQREVILERILHSRLIMPSRYLDEPVSRETSGPRTEQQAQAFSEIGTVAAPDTSDLDDLEAELLAGFGPEEEAPEPPSAAAQALGTFNGDLAELETDVEG